MKKRSKRRKPDPLIKPKVNPELRGFELSINTFGEIQSTYKVDEINEFLTENLADKKLKNVPRGKKD